MPAGKGYRGWGQRRSAVARSRSVAGSRGGGGTRTVSVHRAFSGGAQRLTSGLTGRANAARRGRGKKVGLRRQGY